MECLILPNELFDDGSIECKTFCVVNDPNYSDDLVCEYSTIIKYYSQYIPQIKSAMQAGKHYIGLLMSIPKDHPKAMSFGETQFYMEIQWD